MTTCVAWGVQRELDPVPPDGLGEAVADITLESDVWNGDIDVKGVELELEEVKEGVFGSLRALDA